MKFKFNFKVVRSSFSRANKLTSGQLGSLVKNKYDIILDTYNKKNNSKKFKMYLNFNFKGKNHYIIIWQDGEKTDVTDEILYVCGFDDLGSKTRLNNLSEKQVMFLYTILKKGKLSDNRVGSSKFRIKTFLKNSECFKQIL